ncbi:MAG: hypothetical protein M0024_10130 [Nitrospiraceae bacterium]|nr:hypothetical protein [Nitrospiraceae bacterium]
MKRLLFAVLLSMMLSGVVSAEWVRGSYKDTDGDGIKDTYVNGYNRTKADNNPYNNYSTRGNVNPYTGQSGTVNPYKQNSNTRYNNTYQNPYSNYYGR